MAVGEDAQEAGYPLVPNGGEEGRVKWGAREINRTRDFVAQLKNLIPITKAQYREKLGMSYGTTLPSNAVGEDGDIFDLIV